MSSKINFSGSLERFLKGDADPANIFGFNPSRAEFRANDADRARRASQIKFEGGSASLRAAGGTTDAATKQVKKLRNRTGNAALSPFNPVPLPSVTITAAAIAEKKKSNQSAGRRRALAASNQQHADTALTKDNLLKDDFPKERLRRPRSILGRQSRAPG